MNRRMDTWKTWAIGTILLNAGVAGTAAYQYYEGHFRYSLVAAAGAALLSIPGRWRGTELHDVALVFSALMTSVVICLSAAYDLFNPFSSAADLDAAGPVLLLGLYSMLADYVHRIFAFGATPGIYEDGRDA